jgi:hypothetical protein
VRDAVIELASYTGAVADDAADTMAEMALA